jgi:hypothetical protein
MKKTLKVVLILSLLSIFLIAASPADTDLVRLTITNNSNDLVTLRMEGPSFYYLTVRSGETRIFTPKRGEYSARLYSCGVFVNKTMDLTVHQKILVPACGTKATTGDSSGTIDAGKLIKIVRVHFTNKSDKNLVIILRGPGEFVFFIRSGETKTYTIPKGDYDVQQYGCPVFKEFSYYAWAHNETDLICEKY